MQQATQEPCSGMFRSEDMQLISIAFERGRVKKDMLALGELGCMQFCDLNNERQAFAKEFTSDIRRCEDLQRKLRYFQAEMHRWAPGGGWRVPAASPKQEVPAIEDMEESIGNVYPELQKQTQNYDQMKEKWMKCYESCQVHWAPGVVNFCSTESREDGVLGVLAGTIPSSKVRTMERLVYRSTKGNVTSHFSELVHPAASDYKLSDAASLYAASDFDRHVFFFVFTSQSIKTRLKRLALSMEAHIVMENPLSAANREEEAKRQEVELNDCTNMLAKARESARELLQMQVAPNMLTWQQTVVVHKSIAHNMNMLQLRAHSAVAVAWVPTVKLPEVKAAVGVGAGRAESVLMELETPSHVMPPTYFQTNKFTETFQGIVNAYGTPRYKEINPGVLTIVTFPWLFGVMYGDIGHGLIVMLMAIILILMEKKLEKMKLNEMVDMVFGARYLLLIMGFMATYYGFLYNDTFGMMFNYVSTGFGDLVPDKGNNPVTYRVAGCGANWGNSTHYGGVVCNVCEANLGIGKDQNYTPKVWPQDFPNAASPTFGVDVQYYGTSKKLEIYNSFKMKSAIVIGVLHMTVGLVLQFFNHRYFKDWKHIYFGFIPEFLFLSCTFGYMSIMICFKWVAPFYTSCRVSLLETMVNFFLKPSGADKPELYAGQIGVQMFLLFVALVCVCPFMLFPIPYIEWKANKDRQGPSADDDEDDEGEELMGMHGHSSIPINPSSMSAEDELVSRIFQDKGRVFDMQEVVIKQIIHTIEFVLGSVSNTASYLRLWALSLAHAQLSDVFFEFLIMLPLELDGVLAKLAIPISFSVWLSATLGVLIGMEALSAFLHALRLHWVEFQNKFFIADGNIFQPLDLQALRDEADADTST